MTAPDAQLPLLAQSLAAPVQRLTLADVLEVLLFRGGFNTNTVIAGTTLLGIAAGIVGTFMLLRKRALVTDALSHATLPGIAAAFLIAGSLGLSGRSLPILLLGAAVTGVLAILSIQLILRSTRLREDAAIGIVLSVSFGLGIVLLSYIQVERPSGSGGLNHFIYGQAAAMQPREVAVMAGIAGLAIIAAALLLKEFTLTCFNESFARSVGWPVSFIDLLMMALVVLVTVAGLQSVGLILVVAMLIVPSVAARFWSERLWKLVMLSGVIGGISGYLGSVLSSLLPRYPAGAVIVLTAGIFFVLSMLGAPKRGVLAIAWRRQRFKFLIAAEHLLEAAAEQADRPFAQRDLDELAHLRRWPLWLKVVLPPVLRWRGLLANESATAFALTKDGRVRGERIVRNHALWEQYLISFADIAPSHVDWSVDQVEHILSPPLIERLEQKLKERGVVIAEGGQP